MKHIIFKLGFFLFLSMVSTSCNFLELEPKIILTKDFYTTEKSLNFGLASIYGALSSSGMYGSDYSLHISNPDDLCYQNREPKGESEVFRYTHNASNLEITAAWEKIYGGIKNANDFMVSIDNSKFDVKNLYYSEARFLRAFYHFLLAQAWGDVPLRETPVLSASEAQIAATPQEDILKWVVEEMELVWTNFEENDHKFNDGAPSRITQSTIEGILARVYLFMAGETVAEVEGFTSKEELYEKSALWSKKVIDRGFHKLNVSYSQVFINMIMDKYDREFNESMWEAEFLGDRSSGFEWSNGRIGDIVGLQSSNGDNNFTQWNCNYTYALYNASLKLWDLYYNEDRTAEEKEDKKFESMDSRSLWNMPPYNYAGRDVDIIVDGEKVTVEFEKSYDKTPYVYNKLPSFNVTADKVFDGKHDKGQGVGHRNAGKWRREVIYEGQGTSKSLFTTTNFPILRYSDVLLMYAEASTRATNAVSQLAYDCVVDVRDRAGIKTVAKGEISGEDDFVTFVLNERARELAFEGLRKYDLIRTNTFVEVMNEYGVWALDERWDKDRTASFADAIGRRVQDKHIYLPIPTAELSVNKLMKQNDKW